MTELSVPAERDDRAPAPAARALIDQVFEVVTEPYVIERGAIASLVEALQETNPAYWDEAFAAASRLGGLIAPPTLALAAREPRHWSPRAEQPLNVSENKLNLKVKDLLGLKVAIVQRCTITWTRPLRPGDALTVREVVRSISERKETRMGPGHFYTIDTLYHDQSGAVVCTVQTTLFGYGRRRPRPASSDA